MDVCTCKLCKEYEMSTLKCYKAEEADLYKHIMHVRDQVYKCTCCGVEFDYESEGGIAGTIGTFIDVAFCPPCYAGICDMVDPFDEEDGE